MKPGHDEPTITINGVTLDRAQSMTVRVAIVDFLMTLDDPERMAALGAIGPLYRERAGEVQDLMFRKATR